MTRGVYITIDVECSMGGAWGRPDVRPVPPSRAIMGEYGRRRMGLPMIVDIMERQGLAGTFFVEPFAAEQGHPDTMAPICEYLTERGQDVQLHVHPNHRHYGRSREGKDFRFNDNIAELDLDEQCELLAEGADRLERWTGRRPAAFRAGNMGASEETLGPLARAGIRIDSSYSPSSLGGNCRFKETERYNGSKWYGDVLEVALSGFRQPAMPGLRPYKPCNVVAISFAEMRDAVTAILESGADAVLILHSFSLFKVRNDQYDGGRPDRIVIRRFERLCRWLGDGASDRPVRTFTELAADVAAGRYEAARAAPRLLYRPWRGLARKAVQAYNRFYWT